MCSIALGKGVLVVQDLLEEVEASHTEVETFCLDFNHLAVHQTNDAAELHVIIERPVTGQVCQKSVRNTLGSKLLSCQTEQHATHLFKSSEFERVFLIGRSVLLVASYTSFLFFVVRVLLGNGRLSLSLPSGQILLLVGTLLDEHECLVL